MAESSGLGLEHARTQVTKSLDKGCKKKRMGGIPSMNGHLLILYAKIEFWATPCDWHTETHPAGGDRTASWPNVYSGAGMCSHTHLSVEYPEARRCAVIMREAQVTFARNKRELFAFLLMKRKDDRHDLLRWVNLYHLSCSVVTDEMLIHHKSIVSINFQ